MRYGSGTAQLAEGPKLEKRKLSAAGLTMGTIMANAASNSEATEICTPEYDLAVDMRMSPHTEPARGTRRRHGVAVCAILIFAGGPELGSLTDRPEVFSAIVCPPSEGAIFLGSPAEGRR